MVDSLESESRLLLSPPEAGCVIDDAAYTAYSSVVAIVCGGEILVYSYEGFVEVSAGLIFLGGKSSVGGICVCFTQLSLGVSLLIIVISVEAYRDQIPQSFGIVTNHVHVLIQHSHGKHVFLPQLQKMKKTCKIIGMRISQNVIVLFYTCIVGHVHFFLHCRLVVITALQLLSLISTSSDNLYLYPLIFAIKFMNILVVSDAFIA